MPMKTPGVYIVEKNAFPNSVVEVATAVPAFIGYTEKAINGSASLTNKPWRISSMAEYEKYFGGPPQPRFTVSLVDASAPAMPTPPDVFAARGQDAVFNLAGKDYRVSRAASAAGGRYLMHQAMRHFFQNGGEPCYVVSVGQYGDDISAVDENKGLVGGIKRLLKEQEPTLLLTPDAVLLSRTECAIVQTAALKHCGYEMKTRFAILDVWGGDLDEQVPNGGCINDFRDDIGVHFLDYAAAYYPWLHTSLVQDDEVDYSAITNIEDLMSMLKDELALEDVKLLKLDIGANRRQSHNALMVASPLYAKIMETVLEQMNIMPPAAAMAGIYTMVDNSRGVWKAPANVSVAGAVKPMVDISYAEQEDLNVAKSGASINAIRSFIGEGTLVWGARTLDGNSLDWRYVNVRRTMIMLEESCRLATKAFVFEPNVANTWVSVKSMISNFLTSIWKRGGLAGAVPEDAFSVQVGLGETMTPEDILEGMLRVTVLVAISRPAEFIEITFQQQMQKS